MTKERIITWSLFAVSLGYFQLQITQLSAQSNQLEVQTPAINNEHFELAEPMGQMQKFMDKLYFAGSAENWDLANFYLHELEEQAESIAHANVTEDEVNVSELTKSLLIPQIEALEANVKKQESAAFQSEYHTLITRCNSCHTATNHEFINITLPKHSMFQNQQFTK